MFVSNHILCFTSDTNLLYVIFYNNCHPLLILDWLKVIYRTFAKNKFLVSKQNFVILIMSRYCIIKFIFCRVNRKVKKVIKKKKKDKSQKKLGFSKKQIRKFDVIMISVNNFIFIENIILLMLFP